MGKSQQLEYLNGLLAGTLMETLDISYTDIGPGFVEARMPVDARHHQPMGILHGGATAALAESVGSAASGAELHGSQRRAVGLELSINHVRSATEGHLIARADAAHLGRSTHLWEIRVRDDRDRLVALAKLTMMVVEPGGRD